MYFGCTALLGSTQDVPAGSCQEIIDKGDSTGDGKYWLDLKSSGNPLEFKCNMSGQGGKVLYRRFYGLFKAMRSTSRHKLAKLAVQILPKFPNFQYQKNSRSILISKRSNLVIVLGGFWLRVEDLFEVFIPNANPYKNKPDIISTHCFSFKTEFLGESFMSGKPLPKTLHLCEF